MKKKVIIMIAAALLLGGAFFAYIYWKRIYAVNTNVEAGESLVLHIPTGAGFEQVLDSLEAHGTLKDIESFRWVAEQKSYPSLVKPGRYVLEGKMTNNELVNKLRAGDQDPLRLTLHNISGIHELAGELGRKLEPDSMSFLSLFRADSALSAFGVNSNTVTAYFLPNTYEVWWTTSPSAFLRRMHREFDNYWNENRTAKAKRLGLEPVEVVTLASIVEKETNREDEKPTVAGLYLNRIDRNMRLQSDPTVIYGIQRDRPHEKITRVYYKHLEYDSPYNTYMYSGLPPGPIKIPELSSIEAVLNHEDHNYIFMVADPKRPGYHNFATNLRQHERNRREYINWANRNGV